MLQLYNTFAAANTTVECYTVTVIDHSEYIMHLKFLLCSIIEL